MLEYAAIHDKLRRAAVEDTGQWLGNSTTFESWLDQPDPKSLWISGKWGTGKSVLASYIIHLLLERCRAEAGTACAYIYCTSEYPFLLSGASTDVGSGRAISYKAVLGSILYQLYGALPQDRDVANVVQLWRQEASILESHLEQAIRDVIDMLKQTFIVIDGLDELQRIDNADFVALCKYIGSLNMLTATTGTKILVLSRPEYPDISSAMHESAAIQIHGNVNYDDISAFVCKEVASLRMGRHAQHMKDELVKGADGVFQWVSAVVSYIRPLKSARARAEAVKDMPPSLIDVYAKTLERILQQTDIESNYAIMALLWVTHAFRPLSTSELTEALSIEPRMAEMDDDDRIDPRHIDELCENCQGLLELSGGVYQLPHDSVREFLLGTPDSSHPSLAKFWNMRSHAQELLAEACLNYLNLQVFNMDRTTFRQNLEQICEDYPLLQYVSNYWGDHVRLAGNEYSASLHKLVHDLLLSINRREVTVQVIHHDEIDSSNLLFWNLRKMHSPASETVPLHLVALFGLKQLLPVYGQDHALFRHGDAFGYLPIDYAVSRQRKEVFDWILDHSLAGIETTRMGEDSRYSLPHIAAIQDWADSLKTLLNLGFDKDISARLRDGSVTPLHSASRHGSQRAVQVLLDAGSDINALDEYGETALVLASRGRNTSICKTLIEAGADIKVKTQKGESVLQYLAGFDHELTALLLERHVDFEADAAGYTPLHVAALYGQVDIVRALCHYMAKDSNNRLRSELNRQVPDGRTVMQLAVLRGHVEVMNVLIEEFDDDPLRTTDKNQTLLHLAAASGEEEFICLIAGIDGINPNAQDANGVTALHVAAERGHSTFISCLIKTYANLNFLTRDRWGKVPLHCAAIHGTAKSAALLSHQGFNIADNAGRLPFHGAVWSGDMARVRLLLRPEFVDIPDSRERTALHIAARAGNHHIVRFLLDEGHAKELRDAKGRTPLHLAATSGQADTISALVSAGFDILSRDQRGYTPVMYALPFGLVQPSIVDQLLGRHKEVLGLDKGERLGCAHLVASYGTPELWNHIWPDGYAADARLYPEGRGPLSFAAENGNSDMVLFLAKLGFGVNDADASGLTPLMYASMYGCNSAVKELLHVGANVDQVDQLGRTALHWAVIDMAPRVARTLLEADPTVTLKDSLGFAPEDYASSTPSLSLLSQTLRSQHHGEGREGSYCRVKTLCAFIETTARKLSVGEPGQSGSLSAHQLVLFRDALIWSLRELRQLDEAFFKLNQAAVADDWFCDICETGLGDPQTRLFMCLECRTALCQFCHDEYLDGEHSLGDCRRELENLEVQTRLVGQTLCPLVRFDARSLSQLLRSSLFINGWLEQKLREYQQVVDDWPRPNDLDLYNFPGWRLISIMTTIVESSTPDHDGSDSEMTALTVALCYPRLMANLQEEVREFSCCGHGYIEIPLLNDAEDGKSSGATDKRLDSSFYAMLAEKYSPSGETCQKLTAEQEQDEPTASTNPRLGANLNSINNLSEVLENYDEKPMTTLDRRLQYVQETLEKWNASTNLVPNLAKWQSPFCADKTLTMRDALWQIVKAVLAGENIDVEIIKMVEVDPKKLVQTE